MKKKSKIIVALALLLIIFFTLVTSVNATSGGFDTINIEIKPTSKNNGGSESDSNGNTNMWWISEEFNTGTRYVLRINGEEVPEEYYINHLSNEEFYSGTNVLKTGMLNDSTWKKHSKIEFEVGEGSYTHVNNWRKEDVSGFGLSNADTLKIINAVKVLAENADDNKWVSRIKEINTLTNVKIEIRAEILVEARTAKDGKYYYMTYNEIRKTGMYSGELSQMGYIRSERGLDALACKLYEKDQEYALNADGSVNCSCNYLKKGGTALAPLYSDYTWKLTTLLGRSDANITFDYQARAPYGSGGGFVKWTTDSSIRYLANYKSGGADEKNFQINMLSPNICSIKIDDKYYTMGMGEYDNKAIGKGIEFIPARGKNETWYTNTGVIYLTAPVYNYYKDKITVPNFDDTNSTAYIFEGWDYIVSTTSGELQPSKVTVTEKWVCGNQDLIQPSVNYVEKGADITSLVQGKKDIFGYTYNNTNPTTIPTTVNSDLTIIHYYTKNPVLYTVNVQYKNDVTGETIAQMAVATISENNYFPTGNKTIESYKVEGINIVGTWGQRYVGYELNTNKVEIDGQKYSLANLPKTIKVTSDVMITFHYEKKIPLNVRAFLVEKVDGNITSIRQENGQKSNADVNTTITATKPNISGTYVGCKVYYTAPEVKTADNVEVGLELKDKLNIKVKEDYSAITVDFIFVKNEYKLTLKYQDLDGNTIRDDVGPKPYPDGESVTPEVPNEIIKDGIIYEYVERDDGASQNEKIIVDKPKTVIIKYKISAVPLTIEYRDIVNGEKKHDDNVITAKVNEKIVVEDIVKKAEAEPELKDGYQFVSREDGKEHYDNTDGIKVPTTIVFEYIKLDPNSDQGLPVVSYPKVDTKYKSTTGTPMAILGETITITIPNSGIHEQMQGYGLTQPTEGWNGKYAQEKYVICECDLYYNGKLYERNTPILVAERNGKSISEGAISLIIPEWVEEKAYKITSIVSSKKGDVSSLNIGDNWNEIYDQTAARGENKIEVIGKLYDFTITNLIEDKYWPSSLFTKDKTEYEADTLPIGQNNQQPAKYNYGISLGSTFFFNVNTIGLKNEKVTIQPKFAYVTKDGVIKDVDLYVKNNGKYELLDSTKLEIQTYLNNNYKKVRTNLEKELEKALKNDKTIQPNRKNSIGKYSKLLIDATQKVPFINYFKEEGKEWYTEKQQEKALEAVSHWYGEYRIPSSTIVMEKGKKPGSGTEYKEGFIIVMFQIKTQDSSGNDYLVYNKQTVGNQWKNENGKADGETIEIQLPKVSAQKTNSKINIKVENGFYPVAIYQVGIKANGSYEIAGTH